MSDTEQQADAPDAAETPTASPAAPPEGKQESFDADYVAKLRAENAKYRTAAKANEDAAKRLAEIEESQKTEQQKLAERLADAERKAAEAELKAARAEDAREKGVPAELLAGSTAEELADYADKLLAFRGEAPKKPAAPPATGQGNVGSALPAPDIDAQITEAQRAGNVTLAMRLTNQKLVAMATERTTS